MSPVKKEIALVLGVVAAVLEALAQVVTSGPVHSVLLVVIPLLAALGIRANVSPV